MNTLYIESYDSSLEFYEGELAALEVTAYSEFYNLLSQGIPAQQATVKRGKVFQPDSMYMQ